VREGMLCSLPDKRHRGDWMVIFNWRRSAYRAGAKSGIKPSATCTTNNPRTALQDFDNSCIPWGIANNRMEILLTHCCFTSISSSIRASLGRQM
jgi:hypothetical protein